MVRRNLGLQQGMIHKTMSIEQFKKSRMENAKTHGKVIGNIEQKTGGISVEGNVELVTAGRILVIENR